MRFHDNVAPTTWQPRCCNFSTKQHSHIAISYLYHFVQFMHAHRTHSHTYTYMSPNKTPAHSRGYLQRMQSDKCRWARFHAENTQHQHICSSNQKCQHICNSHTHTHTIGPNTYAGWFNEREKKIVYFYPIFLHVIPVFMWGKCRPCRHIASCVVQIMSHPKCIYMDNIKTSVWQYVDLYIILVYMCVNGSICAGSFVGASCHQTIYGVQCVDKQIRICA